MERTSSPSPRALPPVDDRLGRHFAGLVDIELGTATAATADEATPYWLRYPPRDLFGIALSGGGIRSATFSLGVLQGLAEDGMLEETDYLSTVSGGGYVGGFWTAWLNRRAARAAHAPDRKRVVDFPTADVAFGEREHASIRHLREFSRFLSPELGVFSVDTGRMLAAAMNAVVPSLVIAAAVLIVAALLLLGVFWVIPGLPARYTQEGGGMLQQGAVGGLAMAASSLIMMAVTRWALIGHRRKSDPTAAIDDVPRWWLIIFFALVAGAIATVLTGTDGARHFALHLLELIRCSPEGACANETSGVLAGLPPWHLTFSALRFALFPAASGLIVVMIIAMIRAWVHTRGQMNEFALELDTISSWFLLAIGFSATFDIAFALAISVGPLLDLSLSALGGAAGLLGLVARLTWVIALRGRGSSKGSSKWASLLLAAAWYIVLAVAVIAALAVVTSWALNAPGWLPVIGLGAALVMAVGLFGIDANYLGMHRFYRGRIARAYLGAAERVRASKPTSSESAADDMSLRDLMPGTPVHLICCAANDLSPSVPMVNLSRGAGSAVLSRAGLSVGSRWYAWKERRSPREPDFAGPDDELEQSPSLASALTASGAAFNTHMGRFSNEFGRASTFVMSALGLRLGLWLPHPRRWRDGVTQAGGGALTRDALGLSSTDADAVFLSDGGHFENTALYELIRRHCRWIIVTDSGADPDVQFNDLSNAIRRVRVDFAVEIRIDLAPLRPGENGRAPQPVAVGDIFYPDGDTGVIVVLKPTLTGTEPPDVANYAATHAEFPHEPTSDQFFGEDQWESYRRLGLHCVRSALWPLVSQSRHDTTRHADSGPSAHVRQRFSDLRRHWFTLPAASPAFLQHATESVVALNAALARDGVSALAAQIRREVAFVAEIDTDPRAYGGVPRKQQLASVSLLRDALIRFEQLYTDGALCTSWSAPQYLGIMNGMARWMRTPFMRAWWPILQSQSSQGFREFVAARFEAKLGAQSVALRSVTRGAALDPGVVTVHDSPAGDFPESRERVVLILSEQEDQLRGPRLEAARLTYVRVPDRNALAWRSEDLDVPASLWGTGFGTAIIDQMRHHPDFAAIPQFVCVPYGPKAPYEARKRHADTMQLYAAAGFAPFTLARDRARGEALFKALECPSDAWVLMHREPTAAAITAAQAT